ncbi:hypothetical protein RCL1_003076 [Eukaryota sp. TZLM3-RCL]
MYTANIITSISKVLSHEIPVAQLLPLLNLHLTEFDKVSFTLSLSTAIELKLREPNINKQQVLQFIASIVDSLRDCIDRTALVIFSPANVVSALHKKWPDFRAAHSKYLSKVPPTAAFLTTHFLPLITSNVLCHDKSISSLSSFDLVSHLDSLVNHSTIHPFKLALFLCCLACNLPTNPTVNLVGNFGPYFSSLKLCKEGWDTLVKVFTYTSYNSSSSTQFSYNRISVYALLIQRKLVDVDLVLNLLDVNELTNELCNKISEKLNQEFPKAKYPAEPFNLTPEYLEVDYSSPLIDLINALVSFNEFEVSDNLLNFISDALGDRLAPFCIRSIRIAYCNVIEKLIPKFGVYNFDLPLDEEAKRLVSLFLKLISKVSYYFNMTCSRELLSSVCNLLNNFLKISTLKSEILNLIASVIIPSLSIGHREPKELVAVFTTSLWDSPEISLRDRIFLVDRSAEVFFSTKILAKFSDSVVVYTKSILKRLDEHVQSEQFSKLWANIYHHPVLVFKLITDNLVHASSIMRPFCQFILDRFKAVYFFTDLLIITVLNKLSLKKETEIFPRKADGTFELLCKFLAQLLVFPIRFSMPLLFTDFIVPSLYSGDFRILTLVQTLFSDLGQVDSPLMNQLDSADLTFIYEGSLKTDAVRTFFMYDPDKPRKLIDVGRVRDVFKEPVGAHFVVVLAELVNSLIQGCSYQEGRSPSELVFRADLMSFVNENETVWPYFRVSDFVADVLAQVLDFIFLGNTEFEVYLASLPSFYRLLTCYRFPIPLALSLYGPMLSERDSKFSAPLFHKTRVCVFADLNRFISEFEPDLQNLTTNFVDFSFLQFFYSLNLSDVYYDDTLFDRVGSLAKASRNSMIKTEDERHRFIQQRESFNTEVASKCRNFFAKISTESSATTCSVFHYLEIFTSKVLIPSILHSTSSSVVCALFIQELMEQKSPNLRYFELLQVVCNNWRVDNFSEVQTRRFALFLSQTFQNLPSYSDVEFGNSYGSFFAPGTTLTEVQFNSFISHLDRSIINECTMLLSGNEQDLRRGLIILHRISTTIPQSKKLAKSLVKTLEQTRCWADSDKSLKTTILDNLALRFRIRSSMES